MSQQLIIFDEPHLEFRYGQTLVDPRHGLSLFGTFDADLPSKPSLSYAVIGTNEGITSFNSWSQAMNRPSIEAPNDNYQLWPPYPGFETSFCQEWPTTPIWQTTIDREKLIQASRKRDQHERAFEVVEHYLEAIRRAHKLDERPRVAVCVVPDEVWLNCRPQSHVKDPLGIGLSAKHKQARKAGQTAMFDTFDPDQYWHSPDFRRQLKARSMKFDIPIQIIRETTLRLSNETKRGQRELTTLSDRMWNLGATLYYKCGGKPWRLVTAREGVCYIGIAFRRTDDGKTACCAAQMFLNTGDGVVFLGEYGPWYSPDTKQCHLDKSAAQKLLSGVLKTYRELEGKDLTEIFLHSRSTLDDLELQGFQEACPEGVKLVGVRVRSERLDGLRLFRDGDLPVLRGSFWKVNDKSGLLWGSGYKAVIGTYDGHDVPVPLQIDVLYGDVPVERVAQDILGLTKLNYNACRLGDAEPVTVGFSDEVGEILISNPKVSDRRPNFKFYI